MLLQTSLQPPSWLLHSLSPAHIVLHPTLQPLPDQQLSLHIHPTVTFLAAATFSPAYHPATPFVLSKAVSLALLVVAAAESLAAAAFSPTYTAVPVRQYPWQVWLALFSSIICSALSSVSRRIPHYSGSLAHISLADLSFSATESLAAVTLSPTYLAPSFVLSKAVSLADLAFNFLQRS